MSSATGTESNAAASASDTTILAANGGRKGATIYNDSSASLYLLPVSGTASSSMFGVRVIPYGYYEVPFGYLGVVKGVWTAATGSARVTEFT